MSRLDRLRDNNNLYAGLRLEGQFERMHYRVACRVEAGTDLVSATSHQAEFQLCPHHQRAGIPPPSAQR